MKYLSYFVLSFLWSHVGVVFADTTSELLWLTESAPPETKGAKAHDSYAEGKSLDTLYSSAKHLWLRQGDDPNTAKFAHPISLPASICIIDNKGLRHDLFQTGSGLYHVKVDLPKPGFYNAYLINQSVQGDVLNVNVAKAELLKGSCCVKTADNELTKTAVNNAAPLELVRTHWLDAGLFTRLASGDKLNFTVLANGKPQSEATVTMITQQGWRKTALSDAQGNVAFTLIRDYFPDWQDFQLHHQETFLIMAERDIPTGGELNGTRYVTTRYRTSLSGTYFPSSPDYRSYVIGLAVIAFGGLGIYFYRYKRIKPYREVGFDGVY